MFLPSGWEHVGGWYTHQGGGVTRQTGRTKGLVQTQRSCALNAANEQLGASCLILKNRNKKKQKQKKTIHVPSEICLDKQNFELAWNLTHERQEYDFQ